LDYSSIAIVILNWNGKGYLEQFLPMVLLHSRNARVIVADNASTDDSVSFLNAHFPSVEILENETNGGFAKGYNDALSRITSKYYVLLNSDIEVTENWLAAPFQYLEENPKVAACQPKVLSYHKKNYFEHAGAAGGFIDRNFFPFCRGRILEGVEEDLGQYDFTTEIFWATGACMFIRSEAYWQVNGLDEDFFAHMEEIDMCWRLKRLNWSIAAVPASKVYHVGGGTLAYLSPKKTYLNFRNSLFMICKNYEGLLIPRLFHRMALDGIAGIVFLLTGKFKHCWAVFMAHMHFYKNVGHFYKKRQALKKNSQAVSRIGFYSGSILWASYFKRISVFDKLNKRLFEK
jgi:GT2 family glycosyltransferase